VTYIGQQPSSTFDSGIQDRFTGLTTNTVTLTHDISAETDILVVWNNIVQDSGTYSVGGTGNKTLTLGGTLVSADVVTVYYLNKVMQSVNPTAGSVNTDQLADLGISTAKLQANAVTGAKLNDDVISSQTAITSVADTDELLVSDAGVLKRVDYSHLKDGAGIYNLIAATDLPSEGASFAMDNVFSDTYDKYLIFGERFRNGNAQSRIDFFFRTGGASGADQGSNLGGAYQGRRHSSADIDGSVANGGAAVIAPNVYNDTEYHFMMHVFYPTNTGVNTVFQGKSTFREGSTSYSGFVDFGYISLSTEDHTGFRITSSSGNFNSTACRITVYGITNGA
jgi:hypothetical protein